MEEKCIYDTLLKATREAVKKLFEVNEHFYYCSLMILEDAVPCLSACSEEALAETVKKSSGKYTANDLKWSYADSPYYAYGYDEFFRDVEKLYKPQEDKTELWLEQMEKVMKTLDEEGLFGKNEKREKIFINAEYMPPDRSNVERGRRLNPKKIFDIWYDEMGDDSYDEESGYYSLVRPKMCKVILKQPVTDKKTAMKIRKDFNVSMGLGEFVKFCENTPCTVNDNYIYSNGKELLAKNALYSKIILLKEK